MDVRDFQSGKAAVFSGKASYKYALQAYGLISDSSRASSSELPGVHQTSEQNQEKGSNNYVK